MLPWATVRYARRHLSWTGHRLELMRDDRVVLRGKGLERVMDLENPRVGVFTEGNDGVFGGDWG